MPRPVFLIPADDRAGPGAIHRLVDTVTGLINGCGSVGAILGGLLPGYLSTSTLFYGFAAAAADRVSMVRALTMLNATMSGR